jgi:hypothetical protein
MAECASDDQRRHRCLTLAPTPEPSRDEEVLVEDCSDDEEDGQGAWTTVSQGGYRRLGRFWAQGDASDDEESIAPSSPEELISTASREVAERQEAKEIARRTNDCAEEFIAATARSGFSMEDLAQAEQVHDAEKVSFSSPSSSDFRCPLSREIINAVSREGSLKRRMKPWKGPLPQPRISPPQTSGDAVIKNSITRRTKDTTVV